MDREVHRSGRSRKRTLAQGTSSSAVGVEARLRAVFGRQPELHRFVIGTRREFPDHIDRQSLDCELFITEITLYPRRGTKQYDEVYADIARAITQVVAELPEALRLKLPRQDFRPAPALNSRFLQGFRGGPGRFAERVRNLRHPGHETRRAGQPGLRARTSSWTSPPASKRSSSAARRCRDFRSRTRPAFRSICSPRRSRAWSSPTSASILSSKPALTERVYDEIAVGLLDFICALDARSALNGRTFVRRLQLDWPGLH